VIPGQPARRGQWWSVGVLADDVAGEEWTLWLNPERRVVRPLPRPAPQPAIPERRVHPDGRFYDGMRRRWLLPDGTLAPDGTNSGPLA
ncbi:MAG: hypothetical protein ACR2J8_04745, partial [Thermomicrobiales bacterium]